MHQLAVGISQVECKAVKLKLHYICGLRQRVVGMFAVVVGDQFLNPVIPVDQLLFILRFVEAP
ncbi:hypothetical protein D3C73_1395760 [compost metagenome]